MDERQKEFLQTLIDCGISMNTLLAVGMLIKTEPAMKLMAGRILEEEERGLKITDSVVGQILVDIMKMASEDIAN